jgi:hypothetical protein
MLIYIAPAEPTPGFDHTQIDVEGMFLRVLLNTRCSPDFLIDLDHEREPPFRTINVPVHPLNRPALLEAAKTHVFNPLCAFVRGHRDAPLRPAEYSTILPGAIVKIKFTLSHKLLRRPKNTVSHFAATIDEIKILERPPKISLSPSKLNNQAMFKRKRDPDSDKPGPSSKRICAA